MQATRFTRNIPASPSPLRDFWHCEAKNTASIRSSQTKKLDHEIQVQEIKAEAWAFNYASYAVILRQDGHFTVSCLVFYEMIYYPNENIIIFDLTFIFHRHHRQHHHRRRRCLCCHTHIEEAKLWARHDISILWPE